MEIIYSTMYLIAHININIFLINQKSISFLFFSEFSSLIKN